MTAPKATPAPAGELSVEAIVREEASKYTLAPSESIDVVARAVAARILASAPAGEPAAPVDRELVVREELADFERHRNVADLARAVAHRVAPTAAAVSSALIDAVRDLARGFARTGDGAVSARQLYEAADLLAARTAPPADAVRLELAEAKAEVVCLRGEVMKANEGRKRADFYFDLVRRAVGATPETTRDDVTSMVDALVDEKTMAHKLDAARAEGEAAVLARLQAYLHQTEQRSHRLATAVADARDAANAAQCDVLAARSMVAAAKGGA